MKTLQLTAPAKLNLFLHITGRRPDGYHLLQTLFQLLDYGDTLSFTLRTDTDIRVFPAIDGITPSDNLVWRAAKVLQDMTSHPCGIDIHLEKHLPMGGGVGGGSSDAATTLLALNHLWQLNLPVDQLAAIGLQLGADVPVFVHGKTALAEGVGEQLLPVETEPKWFLVVHPGCAISTARVFSEPGLTRDTPSLTIAPALAGQWQKLCNDCEIIVRNQYPQVDEAIRFLSHFAPSRLTGTGACVFAVFTTEQEARRVQTLLPDKGWQSFVAKGVNRSSTHRQLSEQFSESVI